MKNIFAYLEFGTSIVMAVGMIQHLVRDPGVVTGSQILAAVNSPLFALQAIVPKLAVPQDVAAEIANAAALAINKHYKKA